MLPACVISLAPYNASFVTPEYRTLHDDVVWEVCWNDRPSYLCLILEFQSSVEYWMGLRITAYTTNLWRDLVNRKRIKIGAKLPPVFPIVLYNGEKAWNAPINIQDLVDMQHEKLIPHQPSQEYVVIDAKRIPKEAIEKAKGDAAYVIRGEQADNGSKLVEIGREFISSKTEPNDTNLRKTVVDWLDMRLKKIEPDWTSNIDEEQPQMLAEFLKEVEKVENKYRAREKEAFEEGEARVMACQRKGLLEMLSVRFGEIPPDWQNAISKLNDPDKISELTISILKVKSPEEYGKLLMAAANP